MSVYFTDTDCELWYTDVDKYNINIIKMPYTLDDEEYFYDMGRNTDFQKLFKRMKEGALPITSALNPQDYIDYFEPVLAGGEDIFYVHFSDQLSGTFKHMQVAINELREKYPERKITIFDTKSICMGGGFIALEAGKMHHAGKSDDEILKFLKDFTPHVATYFVVENLQHLRRGGRISAMSATFGTLLNIKPILKITDEGKIEKWGTGKGMKKAVLDIINNMKENYIPGYTIYIVDAINKDLSDFAEKELQKVFPNEKIEKYPIGPVIGAHCGPGTLGVIYYGKHR